MHCQRPISIKVMPPARTGYKPDLSSNYSRVLVRCGTCPACLRNKQDELTQRLLFEQDKWFQTLFVTYTYDNDHCPVSLSKSDLSVMLKTLSRNFNAAYGVFGYERVWNSRKGFKRLEWKKVLQRPFSWKYYVVGEYGDTRERPHYHLVLFLSARVDWHIIQQSNTFGCVCDISVCGQGALSYVAKYTVKQVLDDKHTYDYGGRERPFYWQSNGIGTSFLGTSLSSSVHRSMDYKFRDAFGFLHTLPKYLRNKLFNADERFAISQRISDEKFCESISNESKFSRQRNNDRKAALYVDRNEKLSKTSML